MLERKKWQAGTNFGIWSALRKAARHIMGSPCGKVIDSEEDIALCSYPSVKMEIGDSRQISTTAPIFSQYDYNTVLHKSKKDLSYLDIK